MRNTVIRKVVLVVLVLSLLVPMLWALPNSALAASVPTVETMPAGLAGQMAAGVDSRITYNGGCAIIERGFSWGTTPSCSDGWTAAVGVSGNYFSHYFKGLNPRTPYYFQAWPKNNAGRGIWSALSFTLSQPASPPLGFTSLSPATIRTRTAPYDARLEASGTNFNNVNQVTFTWRGPDRGTETWNKGDRNWNSKVRVNSAGTSMTLRPRVVQPGATWSGTVQWTVTLRDTTGATASRSFTTTYTTKRPPPKRPARSEQLQPEFTPTTTRTGFLFFSR